MTWKWKITRHTKVLVLEELKKETKIVDIITKYKHKWVTQYIIENIRDNSNIFRYKIIDWVEYKKCSTCRTYKVNNSENYWKNVTCKGWLDTNCKHCRKIAKNNYRILNPKKYKAMTKRLNDRYREKNWDKIRESQRRENWSEEKIKKQRLIDRKYYAKNKEKIKLNRLNNEKN